MDVLHLIYFLIIIHVPVFGEDVVPVEYEKSRWKKQDDEKDNNPDEEEHDDEEYRKQVSAILLEGKCTLADKSTSDIPELIGEIYTLKDSNIELTCVREIWALYRNEVGKENMALEMLEYFEGYFQDIPDTDVAIMSARKDADSSFLGNLKTMQKHDTAVIMSGLTNNHEKDYYLNHTNIDEIYALLCGISHGIIERIPNKEFRLISGEVFKMLYPCSLSRLRWLLEKMMKSSVHGPPQVWNADVVEKLDLILLALLPYELRSIRPEAMEKISPAIIDQMDMKLINAFSRKQMTKINFHAFLAYKKRFHYASCQVYHKINFNFQIILFIILFFLY